MQRQENCNTVLHNKNGTKQVYVNLKNLRFVNNEFLKPDDHVRKIRSVIDKDRRAFIEVYTPGKKVPLKEFLMKCKSGFTIFKVIQ